MYIFKKGKSCLFILIALSRYSKVGLGIGGKGKPSLEGNQRFLLQAGWRVSTVWHCRVPRGWALQTH